MNSLLVTILHVFLCSFCKGLTLYSVVRERGHMLDVNKTRQIAQDIVKVSNPFCSFEFIRYISVMANNICWLINNKKVQERNGKDIDNTWLYFCIFMQVGIINCLTFQHSSFLELPLTRFGSLLPHFLWIPDILYILTVKDLTQYMCCSWVFSTQGIKGSDPINMFVCVIC